MGTTTGQDPERDLKRTADELEERLGTLDEHIHDAAAKAEDVRPEESDEALPLAANPPEGGDEPPTVEGRRDGDDEGSSAG